MLTLLSFPLSAATAYLLGRHLALSPAGAALAALAYAFSPFHLAHAAYHVHIAQTQWFPLYLLALFRCLDEPTPKAVGLLAVATACVTLSNFYGGLIAAVITPVAIAAYWLGRARAGGRSTRGLLVTVGSLLLLAARRDRLRLVRGPGRRHQPRGRRLPPRGSLPVQREVVGLSRPAGPEPRSRRRARRLWLDFGRRGRPARAAGEPRLGGHRAGPRRDRPVAGARSTACRARERSDRRRRSRSPRSLCSLSPERRIGPFTIVRPSGVLYALVPMFRAYARFGVIVQLMAALLAGIGCDRGCCAPGRGAGGSPARRSCCSPSASTRSGRRRSGGTCCRPPRTAGSPGSPSGCASSTARDPRPRRRSVPWLTGRQLVLAGGAFDDCTAPDLPGRLATAGFTHLLVRRETTAGRWFASHPPPTDCAGWNSSATARCSRSRPPAPPVPGDPP